MSNTSGLFITTIKFRVLGQSERKFYKFMVEFNNVLQIHGSIMFSSKNNNWFVSWPSETYEDKNKVKKYNNLVYIDNKSSKEAVDNKILSSFNNGDPRDFYSGDSTYIARQESKKNNSGYQQSNQPQQQPQQDSGSYGI